jgi:hypothetical protein
MHGRIAQLAERFVTKNVEHSKWAFVSPRRHLGLRAVGFGKAMDVRQARRIMALVVPSNARPRANRSASSPRTAKFWSPNRIARASWTLRPGPPPGSGIAQTSWRGTSLRSAWQRRLRFWNSAGPMRKPTVCSPRQRLSGPLPNAQGNPRRPRPRCTPHECTRPPQGSARVQSPSG